MAPVRDFPDQLVDSQEIFQRGAETIGIYSSTRR